MSITQATIDQARRLEALRQYDVLNTQREQALDELTALAAQICETPIAVLSLVDQRRQWCKASVGLELADTQRELSFCGYAVHEPDLFIVGNAERDERFAGDPMVTGAPGIRFYAGAPLVNPEGEALGVLSVIDRIPRTLMDRQTTGLRLVACQVMTYLELRRYKHKWVESEDRFRLLADNITDVFWIASPDLRKMYYVSPGYEAIWGWPREDLYVNPYQWVKSIVLEEREHVIDVFAGLMENEPSVSVEYRIARPDSTIRWVHDRGFQVRDAAGGLVRLTGIAADITERKQAEIAARHIAAIVAFSDDAIIGKDLNSIITSWNRGAEKIFGYTSGEMVGTSIMRLIPHDRQGEETHILSKIRAGESVEHFETQRETKDGRLIDVSVTASPIKDADGNVIGVSKVARDITQRKREEEARRASEGRYRTLFEHAPYGIVIADPESYYIDANATACEMLGYTREELIGRHASDIVTPGEVKHIGPALDQIKARSEYDRQWQFRRKDGTTFSADVIATMMPDGNLLGIIRDITEEKCAQERIAEQAALLEKARDAILVRDLEGRILFWNKGAETLYEWTRQEVIGRNIADLIYGESQKFQALNRLVISRGEWHGELQQLTRSKREVTAEVRWTLIRDNEGRPKSVLAINTDITDRKKIEAQFIRAQRFESIGTLASGVAHDLNNILAPIMMSVDVLKGLSTDPQAKRILETIEISAKRGADVVRQVLSFARGMGGERIGIQPKHVLKDLEKIISDTFPKDIRLRFSIPDETWMVLGDPTQLHQILLNLCVNARDAMPNGGNLNVGVENCAVDERYAALNIESKTGRYVSFSVVDSGTGIPRDILDKIFTPFFTTKETNKGTGLGLSTVMAIAKSHGGFVNVYSEIGHGSTFKVYLPAMESGADRETREPESASLLRGDGETILVVDDEASILTITSQTLQAFGYRVLTATDGADAVAVYAQHRQEIAVVLTDMMMPVMDGAATIQALLRINPTAKIIAASGLISNGITVRGEIKHFLSKPYTTGTLLSTIWAILHEVCVEPATQS